MIISATQVSSSQLPGSLFKENPANMQKGLVECFEKGLHSDITLLAPNGSRIRAHQAILSVSSTRFAAILADGKFTQKELPIQGVDSQALETVIRFFYSGECQVQAGTAIALLDAAIKLEAKGLAANVEGYVNQLLSAIPFTCIVFLEQAVGLQMETVASVMQANVVNKIDELVTTPAFCSLEYSAFSRVAKECAARGLPRETLVRIVTRWILAEGLPASVQSQRLGLADEVSSLIGFNILDGTSSNLTLNLNATGAGLKMGSGEKVGLERAVGQGAEATAHSSANFNNLSQLPPLNTSNFVNGSNYGIALGVGVGGGGGGGGISQSFQGQAQSNLAYGSSSLSFQVPALAGGLGGNPSLLNAQSNMLQPQQLSSLMPINYGGPGMLPGGLPLSSYNFLGPLPAQLPVNRGPRPPSAQQRPPAKRKASKTSVMMTGREAEEGLSGIGFSIDPDDPSPAAQCPGDNRVQKLPKMMEGIDRNLCHIVGCGADLTQLREYHQRFRLCDQHLKASAVLKDGVAQRFCQQCGRFHPLEDFDGAKRSCRARLLRHNARRRRKNVAGSGAGNFLSGTTLSMQGMNGQFTSYPFDHHPLPWLLNGQGSTDDMRQEGEDEGGEDEDGEDAYQGEEEEMRAGYVDDISNGEGGGGGEGQQQGVQGNLGSWPGTNALSSLPEAQAPASDAQQPQREVPNQSPTEDKSKYVDKTNPDSGTVMIDSVGCETNDSKSHNAVEVGGPTTDNIYGLRHGSVTTTGFLMQPASLSFPLGFAAPVGGEVSRARSNTLAVGDNLGGKVKDEEITGLLGAQSGFRQMRVMKEIKDVTSAAEFDAAVANERRQVASSDSAGDFNHDYNMASHVA